MDVRNKPNFSMRRYGPLVLLQYMEDTPTHNDGDELVINLDHVVGLEQHDVETIRGEIAEGVRVLTTNPSFAPILDRCDRHGPVLLTVAEVAGWLFSNIPRRHSAGRQHRITPSNDKEIKS